MFVYAIGKRELENLKRKTSVVKHFFGLFLFFLCGAQKFNLTSAVRAHEWRNTSSLWIGEKVRLRN